jgi:hypothetical protein
VNPRRIVHRSLAAALLGAVVLATAAAPRPAPAQEATAATAPAEAALPEIAVTRIVVPEADTFVRQVAPTQVSGAGTVLRVGGSPTELTYLRFRLPDFNGGRLRSANLRLHVADLPGAGAASGGTPVVSSNTSWTEDTTNWSNRPALDGASGGNLGRVERGRWVSRGVTNLLRSGQAITLAIRVAGTDPVTYDARGSGLGPRLVLDIDAPPNGVIVDAVGDMSCSRYQQNLGQPLSCHQMQVSDLVVNDPDVEALLALGDLQYNSGALEEFYAQYEPSYGRVRDITYPTIGNHKYQTEDGDGYWDYWGAQAGVRHQGWRSFDLGRRWHLIALNSNCVQVSCGRNGAQGRWLRADLRANTRPCVAAYMHHPRWSSAILGGGNYAPVGPLIDILSNNRVEMVLSGHAHMYERFAPQRSDTTPAADGIRHFIVGTGGRNVDSDHDFQRPFQRNSQFRLAHTFGLLRMSLTDTGYWWSYVDETGRVRDSGADGCNPG